MMNLPYAFDEFPQKLIRHLLMCRFYPRQIERKPPPAGANYRDGTFALPEVSHADEDDRT